jgi:hypothetical protein
MEAASVAGGVAFGKCCESSLLHRSVNQDWMTNTLEEVVTNIRQPESQ